MPAHIKAAVVSAALVLAIGLAYFLFWDRIDKNQAVPEAQEILKRIEKNGAIDFTLNNLAGQPVHMHDFKDKVVILNFWASWCAPCVEEFPSMLALLKAVPEVRLIAVSADQDEQALRIFLKAFQVDEKRVDILRDPDQKIARLYGTEILPESFIFQKGGKLLRKIVGAEKWAHPEAIQFFKTLTAE
jgi:cytochrome c biogenesis protein CcmG/thiol:disulfide interchange protein DsbE